MGLYLLVISEATTLESHQHDCQCKLTQDNTNGHAKAHKTATLHEEEKANQRKLGGKEVVIPREEHSN